MITMTKEERDELFLATRDCLDILEDDDTTADATKATDFELLVIARSTAFRILSSEGYAIDYHSNRSDHGRDEYTKLVGIIRKMDARLSKRRSADEILKAYGPPPGVVVTRVRIPAPRWEESAGRCDCSGDADHPDHRVPFTGYGVCVCDRCGCDIENRLPCAGCVHRGSDVY